MASKTRKRYLPHPGGTMAAIWRSRPMAESEQRTIAIEVHLAWQAMLDGTATVEHFDSLAMAINVVDALAIELGDAAKEITQPGKDALQGIRDRYLRIKRFGVDAPAIRDIPPALELHDECLRTMSPHQFQRAFQVVAGRHGII